jgi:hypothetical protein
MEVDSAGQGRSTKARGKGLPHEGRGSARKANRPARFATGVRG